MQMSKKIWPIMGLIFFLTGVLPAWGQKSLPVHGLSESQLKSLKALKTPILVPGKLPPGFQLKQVDIPKAPDKTPYGLVYRLDYRCFCSGANISFSLMGTAKPFQQGVTTELEIVKNARLDPLRLGLYPGSRALGLSEPYWMTKWIKKGRLNHALVSTYQGQTLSKSQAQEIVRFLLFLESF